MPTVLHVNPEDLDTADKRGNYTVSIIGCHQKGVLYTVAFADAGFKVICADADQTVVKRLAKGKTKFPDGETEAKLKRFIRAKKVSLTGELKVAVAQSDIVVMTATAKVDDKKTIDYSEVESTCKKIGAALHRGALFIYVGTAGFGFTESVIKETLENTSGFKVGGDFALAYNPLTSIEEQPVNSIKGQELKVVALEKNSLEAASTVLATLTGKGVKRIMDVKAAELAVLFMAAKQDMETALANELAVFCESAGLDYSEVLKLMNLTDSSVFFPTIDEENNREETYLLFDNAETLNTKLRLSKLARQVNEDMTKHAVNLAQDTLRSCGKTLRRARVAALGTAKTGTAAESLIKLLEKKGAKISLYDPLLGKNESPSNLRVVKRTLNEAVEGADCIFILTAQDQFKRLSFKKLRAVMRMPAAVIDLVGLVDPPKVEKEGLTYRCLGKGEAKK